MVKNTGNVARRQLKNVALFGAEDEVAPNSNLLPLNQIELPKRQPRRYFDPEKQASLVDSIRKHGLLEPLLVRTTASGYELVAGERRYRAAKTLKLTEVNVVIRDMDDRQAQEAALVENLQREDLNPLEETEAILDLLSLELEMPRSEVTGLLHQLKKQEKDSGNNVIPKIEKVFSSLGTMSWLSFTQNRLQLLNLPKEILEALSKGKIAYTKAIAVGRVKDDDERMALLTDVIKNDLSLVEVKERIGSQKDPGAGASPTEGDISTRLNDIYKRVKKAKLWDDPKKQKRLLSALESLEKLLDS
jgi:ParB family transcriptional regulator, chromosome partitioning protein